MENICKINDVEYRYEYLFKNSDNEEVRMTSSAVRNLTIVDNIYNPFLRGSVSIANPYDIFEEKYIIRGDGRDEFKVFLKPVDDIDGLSIDETFILLKEENMGDLEVRSENMKNFKILHKDILPFLDTLPYNKKFEGKVGDILKDIFIELLGEDKVDSDNWESGDFEIEYIPPVNFKYRDLVYHLLKFFFGKHDDLYVKGFILRNSDKKYYLSYLSNIFQNNDSNMMDVFLVADLADDNIANNENNPQGNHELKKYANGVKNFCYDTPSYEHNNSHFINSIVHGYDKFSGTHCMKILRIQDIEDKWKTKFVDSFKCLYKTPIPFVIKNQKTAKKFKHYRLPYDIEDSVKMVEAEMYNILTFYNLNCSFTNLGDIKRSSGTFIDLIKIGNIEFKGDQKMFGRWFTTEVRHVISNDSFYNDFKCCKTYVGPSNTTNNDVE